jgi:hypothetical protein
VGIKYIRNKLYCGDYKRIDSTATIIDTKKDLLELSMNLCTTTNHERIKREIAKAKDIGNERFIFLICDKAITSINEVSTWDVPIKKTTGCKLTQVKPETLQKIMETMALKYNIEFLFCRKEEMGCKIIELLSN